MPPTLRLFSAVFLAVSLLPVIANAHIVRRYATPITLPFAKRVNTTGTAKLLEIDQARARALRARAEGEYHPGSDATVPATNIVVTYVTTVRLSVVEPCPVVIA